MKAAAILSILISSILLLAPKSAEAEWKSVGKVDKLKLQSADCDYRLKGSFIFLSDQIRWYLPLTNSIYRTSRGAGQGKSDTQYFYADISHEDLAQLISYDAFFAPEYVTGAFVFPDMRVITSRLWLTISRDGSGLTTSGLGYAPNFYRESDDTTGQSIGSGIHPELFTLERNCSKN